MLTDKLELVGKAVATSADMYGLLSFPYRSLRLSLFFYITDHRINLRSLLFLSIGYDRILFARLELQEMLFKKIPSSKMHMSKKVVSFQQNDEGVTVRFGDDTTSCGDILVGADGAHSTVRQHLYKTLTKKGILPKTDNKEMSRGYISLVGTTEALDPAKYPGILDEDSESYYVVGDKDTPYTVSRTWLHDNPVKGNSCSQVPSFALTFSFFSPFSTPVIQVGYVHGTQKQDLLECHHPTGDHRYRR
jgi:hypothetical protein